MKRLFVFLISLLFLSGFWLFFRSSSVIAEDTAQLETKIREYETKLLELNGQKQTLSKTINYLNTKIQLIQAQISATEAEIIGLEEEVQALSGKIVILDSNLEKLSSLLVNRIHSTYIKASSVQPMYLLFTSDGFSDFLKRYKYLQVGQKHDKQVMFALEEARTNFDEQKQQKVLKQDELEKAKKKLAGQKLSLNQQQLEKQSLLQITKNDEKKFQELLAQAKAEYEAIQGIIAGKGTETKVGAVKEGDRIASIIQGDSCNSSGTHLHFLVKERDSQKTQNPFNNLKGGVDYENCTGEGACSAADSFNPSGSWTWPIQPKIRYLQGYGTTWATQYNPIIKRIYSFHNGIDINSLTSSTVKAVKNGTLYQGSYKVGCLLRYVRVEHDDGGIDTYYLHVNY